MEKETQSVFEMGIETAVGALLLFISVTLILFGKRWYFDEAAFEYSKQDVAMVAAEYSMTNRESVTGADIVEYILKYGSTYDYKIVVYQTWSITKEYAKYLYSNNKNGGYIWTENFLTESVFNNRLTDEFTVAPTYSNGEIIAYTFTKKQ
ncbi:MAG: hypothetical protein QM644_08065 [Mobilitalea sp.]